jgi:hypothetical protein
MEENYSEQEQILLREKVANYVSRHPEFIDEILKRMEEEEKGSSGGKLTEYSAKDNYSGENNHNENKGNEDKRGKIKKGIFSLDEEKINTISEELSGLLFKRDESNKSVLEKTVQDAFSGMVKNYLSKYVG